MLLGRSNFARKQDFRRTDFPDLSNPQTDLHRRRRFVVSVRRAGAKLLRPQLSTVPSAPLQLPCRTTSYSDLVFSDGLSRRTDAGRCIELAACPVKSVAKFATGHFPLRKSRTKSLSPQKNRDGLLRDGLESSSAQYRTAEKTAQYRSSTAGDAIATSQSTRPCNGCRPAEITSRFTQRKHSDSRNFPRSSRFNIFAKWALPGPPAVELGLSQWRCSECFRVAGDAPSRRADA